MECVYRAKQSGHSLFVAWQSHCCITLTKKAAIDTLTHTHFWICHQIQWVVCVCMWKVSTNVRFQFLSVCVTLIYTCIYCDYVERWPWLPSVHASIHHRHTVSSQTCDTLQYLQWINPFSDWASDPGSFFFNSISIIPCDAMNVEKYRLSFGNISIWIPPKGDHGNMMRHTCTQFDYVPTFFDYS